MSIFRAAIAGRWSGPGLFWKLRRLAARSYWVESNSSQSRGCSDMGEAALSVNGRGMKICEISPHYHGRIDRILGLASGRGRR